MAFSLRAWSRARTGRPAPPAWRARLGHAVADIMPVNAMVCDAASFEIVYANRAALEALGRIEHLLPIRAEQLIGSSIDVFHKDPGHQRRMLADPRNLPHRSRITLGGETLDLVATALFDAGRYVAIVLTWAVATGQVRLVDGLEHSVKGVSQRLAASAEALESTATAVAGMAETTSTQATAVAAASTQLAGAVGEIARQVQLAKSVSENAVDRADASNGQISALAEAASEIGNVVGIIKAIAEQTNLLALNATIEAARAGDAGRGFAVVAQEVKSLASQTAKATETIATQIGSIQAASGQAVTAIKAIGGSIQEMQRIMSTIAAAVEEQDTATREVGGNIGLVTQAAADAGRASSSLRVSSGGLAGDARQLTTSIESYLVEARRQ